MRLWHPPRRLRHGRTGQARGNADFGGFEEVGGFAVTSGQVKGKKWVACFRDLKCQDYLDEKEKLK